MKAEVISVAKAKLKNKFDGYEFTYQGEPYQGRRKDPTTRFVFGNSAEADVVKDLKPGQWVDLEFTQNGQYKNLSGVTVIKSPTEADSGGAKKGGGNWDDTQKRISRSAAMKEATTIILSKAKAADKVEDIVTRVKDITRELEAFLNFETEEEDAVGKLEEDAPFN